jgi:glycosyltransferase involved in cell wall biosynthesis
MKILNVNMSLDPLTGGGTGERTFQMSRSLARVGMECILLTTSIGLTPQRISQLKGINVVAFKSLNNRFYLPKLSFNRVWNVVADADIVHLMNHWTFLNALVYLIVRRLNKPYVVCPAGALPIYGRSKIIKRLYNWIIGKRIIQNADGHIAIARNEINHFQDYGVKSDRVFIIPNGVDTEDFIAEDDVGFREKYGLGSDPFVMFVGRLNRIKGPDLLVRAFCNVRKILERFRLIFVGPDGGMLVELQQVVSKHGAEDQVRFLGYLDGEDKSNAYHAADLVVIPSRQEAMSIVAVEAGITGTTILITDQCGFDEVATIGGGKVVAASVDALQEGLLELLKDRVLLKLTGEKLKRYTYENFIWDSVVNKYIALYRKLLK